ncbi:GNAT family N-acetyltransferase [Burkholderia sp. Ac-20353]|uniref:GNAT family N-acetyltransferase n=1 Tax=Burkholderia sp. Ac-20353 TaxID=2703894 RepID=UPI00197C8861|nr:GNAT family N-acetyltransferase [Burkholderia sp. Ac-20353]MBN3789080.1 GNAT family N-acetyltransferase [Burkholderia sp. Ac-20353]
MHIDHLVQHPEFIPSVATWHHEAFGYLNPAVTLDQRVARLGQHADDSLPMTLLALSDHGDAQGVASLVQSTLTHQHLGPWLSAVFVPPVHRGKGIASELAIRARIEASRMGHRKIFLFTPRNESLYARLGWRTIDTAQIGATSAVVMEADTGA